MPGYTSPRCQPFGRNYTVLPSDWRLQLRSQDRLLFRPIAYVKRRHYELHGIFWSYFCQKSVYNFLRLSDFTLCWSISYDFFSRRKVFHIVPSESYLTSLKMKFNRIRKRRRFLILVTVLVFDFIDSWTIRRNCFFATLFYRLTYPANVLPKVNSITLPSYSHRNATFCCSMKATEG